MFDKDGKGVVVPGPDDWTEVGDFTLSFWVLPTQLNADSYFISLFDRIQVKASSIDSKVKFLFEKSTGVYIEPTYTTNTISMGSWVYVAVSLQEYADASAVHKYR